MADEKDTAGTTPQDDGDAQGTATTGTPDGAGRDGTSDEPSGEPDYKALHLANKQTIAELKATIEAIGTRVPQPPAADDDEDSGSDDGDEDAVDWDQVREFAKKGDPVAKAQIANAKRLMRFEQTVANTILLRDIDDKGEREEVKRHMLANQKRGRPLDIKSATAEVRAAKLVQENERLHKELEQARKKPPQDTVRTHTREVTARQAKDREAQKMTYAEWDNEQAELERQGRHREARERQFALNRGEIDLE